MYFCLWWPTSYIMSSLNSATTKATKLFTEAMTTLLSEKSFLRSPSFIHWHQGNGRNHSAWRNAITLMGYQLISKLTNKSIFSNFSMCIFVFINQSALLRSFQFFSRFADENIWLAIKNLKNQNPKCFVFFFVQSAGAVEYSDCISAEG